MSKTNKPESTNLVRIHIKLPIISKVVIPEVEKEKWTIDEYF
jgi:hypothetical protein